MGRTKGYGHPSCQRMGLAVQAIVFLLALFVTVNSWAEERLNIAVASNFRAPLTELVSLFNNNEKYHITVSSAASGVLARQIQHGAPFDIFFSADAEHTHLLHDQGLIEQPFHYASGQLVIVANDPWLLRSTNLEGVPRVAIANPKIAPYGRAAVESITAMQLVPEQVIYAPSVAQAYQLVQLAHVDAAIVAASLLNDDTNYRFIPPTQYGELRQEAAITSHCTNCTQARAFKEFLKSEPARLIIKKYHYNLVALDG